MTISSVHLSHGLSHHYRVFMNLGYKISIQKSDRLDRLIIKTLSSIQTSTHTVNKMSQKRLFFFLNITSRNRSSIILKIIDILRQIDSIHLHLTTYLFPPYPFSFPPTHPSIPPNTSNRLPIQLHAHIHRPISIQQTTPTLKPALPQPRYLSITRKSHGSVGIGNNLTSKSARKEFHHRLARYDMFIVHAHENCLTFMYNVFQSRYIRVPYF